MNIQSHIFKIFLEQTLSSFESAACLTAEGEILDLKYETLSDIGTLGASATTVMKYFPLEMGDVVILNDPYSGASTLSMITLVTPLLLKHAQIPNLYLAVRTGFRPRLVISKTLDEEGLRIPPTPLVQGRVINKMILNAISSHPLCPRGISERLESTLEVLWQKVDSFQYLLKKKTNFTNLLLIKAYLSESKKFLQKTLQELPTGEAKVETRLDSGELIRLRLELSQDSVQFDFAGTSPSQRVCLTDSATFGACFGALAAFLQKPILLNSGSFSLLHVTTPLGSLLNAKYPSPTYKGMTEGVSLVAGTVIQALAEIVPHRKFSMSAQTPTQISLEFSNGLKFFDSLPGGVGASALSDGAHAIHLWVRNSLRNSVQEIEKIFPLLIHQIGLRKGSGGKGHFNGGCGLTKEYEMLEDTTLHWIMQQRKDPPKGSKGATNGLPPEISLIKKDGSEKKIEQNEGELKLSKGDRITVSSAGGGGFGKTTP